MNRISVSLAAPAYNESQGLARVVKDWVQYLEKAPFVSDFEIVICNDGSKDSTAEVLNQLAQEHSQVKPVHFTVNQGAAAALTNAIAHTSKEWVLLIDSDGQFPVHYLEPLFAQVQSGYKAAIGVRAAKEDSLFSRFGSASSAALCNFFYGTQYRDFNSAFKLIEGKIIRSLKLEAKGLNYSTDVSGKLLEQGITMGEVDVIHQPRVSGKSSVRALRDASHRLLFVLYLGFRQFLFNNKVLQRPGGPS